MKIRNFFLTWLANQEHSGTYDIDRVKFFTIQDSAYLFQVLEDLLLFYPKVENNILDFKNLERQRFHIIENSKITPEIITDQFIKALDFSSRPAEEKREYNFTVNPKIIDFFASSKYQWYGEASDTLISEEGNYLFVPSICSMPPKEILLTNLNSLLLDLKNFSDKFSYLEFLELVSDSLEMDKPDLDIMLMEFITKQVLYYRTLCPST